MKKILLKTTLSLAVTLASTQLFAGGFALDEESVSAMGTGDAGRSSSADDASTVYGNPAGMSRLKRNEVSLGVTYIDAKSDIKNASSTSLGADNPGTNKGDMVPGIAIPMGYLVTPIDEHWAFGLGIYAPFGLVTDYEHSFQGNGFGNKSKVQVVTIQPTVSYAFNDVVSVGFGPTFNKISGELDSSVPAFGLGTQNVKIKGDDTATGFNAGILVQPLDSTRVGLTYHSQVVYHLSGKTSSSGALSDLFGEGTQRYDAKLDVTTPSSVDFSVTHKLTDDWTLYVGSTWTRWSQLKKITVNNSGVTDTVGQLAGLDSITEEQHWHDTWSHAIGASYQLNKQWVLRTGFTIDQTPTNNTDRSVRIPTGDRTIFSLGAGWSPTDDLTFDVAYSYLKEEPIKVHDIQPTLGLTYDAKYENSASGFGGSVTYKF
ncbi:OmpP1/FadL family transporter [Pseudomonas gingeri]|uniref:Outer membrane protein transport protein n=2 Tax=Pseudomonas gingeri TaxID=117681 RepID=A0A7Y8CP01_9PSED|nr:outer membrane protein transport protein [Pseudomonas gingeri]NWA03475.1 outer membrane protein transport protein [Pseudomonas gingeri]NWA14333.1 outer membrane protein transport protein [Pseudomonas gingeri]NWA55049.1 outer membrane protein transport protein [Pseudomonas gingeri]NWA94773.1 outer membrane protein transport protein [Pseudomonas gingeri]NWB01429.1 outer membrane protein transport protein [Pseudomonas gingeri]